MPSSIRRLLVVGVVVAVVLFAGTLMHAVLYAPSDSSGLPVSVATSTTATSSTVVGPREDPARLQIPSLSIDAKVQYVGVTKSGNLGVPSNFTDVAWYKYGTVPGQIGSAVMDGHVDNAISLPGVFKHLGNIHIGDAINVQTVQGTVLHFTVTDIQTYPYTSLPLEKIFTQNDTARLNLITCGGTWIQSVHSYDQRLVVSAVLTPAEH
jgi:LPXTG-site transpeptidase (sortase) family protein